MQQQSRVGAVHTRLYHKQYTLTLRSRLTSIIILFKNIRYQNIMSACICLAGLIFQIQSLFVSSHTPCYLLFSNQVYTVGTTII